MDNSNDEREIVVSIIETLNREIGFSRITSSLGMSVIEGDFTQDELYDFFTEFVKRRREDGGYTSDSQGKRLRDDFPVISGIIRKHIADDHYSTQDFVDFAREIYERFIRIEYKKLQCLGGGISMDKKTEQKFEQIDGRILSPNQIIFQEMMAERFDEGAWLKKHGLVSPEEYVYETSSWTATDNQRS